MSNNTANNNKPNVKPVDQAEREFEKSIEQVKEISAQAGDLVEDSKETFEKLVSDTRHLAEVFVQAKRDDLEKYASQALQKAQDQLVNSIDETINRLSGSVGKFVDNLTTALQRNINKIDERPMIPVLAALIGGTMLGIFLRGRDIKPIQNFKNRRKSSKSPQSSSTTTDKAA